MSTSHRKPKRISNLPQATLAEIVADVYEILFWTGSDYDPAKPCGADEIGAVVRAFARNGLLPVEEG